MPTTAGERALEPEELAAANVDVGGDLLELLGRNLGADHGVQTVVLAHERKVTHAKRAVFKTIRGYQTLWPIMQL